MLDVKWNFPVFSDLIMDKRCYHKFMVSPEKIASNILAGQLERFQTDDIVWHDRPICRILYSYEYTLTKEDKALNHVLRSIAKSGMKPCPCNAIVFVKVGHRWQPLISIGFIDWFWCCLSNASYWKVSIISLIWMYTLWQKHTFRTILVVNRGCYYPGSISYRTVRHLQMQFLRLQS